MTAPTEGDRGAASLELAVLLPVLIMFLAGLVMCGLAFNAKITLTSAAREGARALALDTGDPVVVARSAAPGIDSNDISVTHSGSPCTPGDPASVTLSYDFPYTIPFFGEGVWTIRQTGTMRCGG